MANLDLKKVEESIDNYKIMEKQTEFNIWYLTNIGIHSENLVCYLESP